MKEGWGNRLWGLMAFFYEEFFKRFPPYRRLIKEIIANLNGLPSSSPICLLDAGCGTGLLSVELARRGYFVLGIDRSSEMLKRARGKKQKENLDNLFFMEGDLNTGISLQKFSFQKILFIHSLYLLEDPAPTLESLASVLRPGGRLSCVTPPASLLSENFGRGGGLLWPKPFGKRGFFRFSSSFPFFCRWELWISWSSIGRKEAIIVGMKKESSSFLKTGASKWNGCARAAWLIATFSSALLKKDKGQKIEVITDPTFSNHQWRKSF